MGFKKSFRAPPVSLGPVYLKKYRQRRRCRRLLSTIATPVIVAGGVFGVGMAATNWVAVSAAASPAIGLITGSNFRICVTKVRWNCIVDGDTFWRNGRKIRIADIDTPEVFSPGCPAEYELGVRATHRLRDLLNEGPFELQSLPDRDTDKFGRQLRVIIRDGRSIGDRLVSEGLARTWTGRREPWCS